MLMYSLPVQVRPTACAPGRGRECAGSGCAPREGRSPRGALAPAGESAPGLLPANARLAEGILARDRRALSKAVTLVESQLPAHNEQARLLIDHVLESRSRDRGPGERGSSPDDAPSGGDSGAAGSGIRPLDADLPPTHLPSFRLGIAGPPGAGKSTFIEASAWVSHPPDTVSLSSPLIHPPPAPGVPF